MRIDEIKPYPRNARRNAEAVPKVAESIKAFGFRGQIVLRSHDDPTIVCGHTRVEALKLLGWDDVPDEHMQWCDDLSDDGERLHVTLPNGRTRTIPYGTHGAIVGPPREYALQVAEYVRRTGLGTFA